ncbi:hypothetical protein AO1008_04254 [Aspergillus oryzae 100-8]|uniref:Uncharacterized protein n=1 Tax=Aspergillus oryzae (strain 3.042) TaxID=1160506 RepID=I8TL78_ASPO3|nr:hypothetical protein Ao3042_08702 [Aspergillus oryzae 3.042]KDE85993.1 hypothetical protein AO1008_04254 [Aspergillus oryzae 100-8]|eukprot:EIT74900.1 hypothetical protein Ao3042_08702 [Aspergillus oryzae 3.042]
MEAAWNLHQGCRIYKSCGILFTNRQDYSLLAHLFIAGHLIECSTYVTGGNFSGFKSLPDPSIDFRFPVKGKDEIVTEGTYKAQLLYKIQGPIYYNPDVPKSGGHQAEVHYFLCGLDIAGKAKLLENQIRHLLDESKYQTLVFRTTGSCPSNPSSQDAATVDVCIFAQSRDEEALSVSNFLRPCIDTIMQSYPGATFAKPYYEYFVSIFPQERIRHISHIPFRDTSLSYETAAPFDLGVLAHTIRCPLGYVVHARSGDKGSDTNGGFFVRHADKWNWLRNLLSTDEIRELLGQDDTDKKIFRFELPNIWVVYFLLKDHLDRGMSSSSYYDVLGKNVAEFLRCRYVDIPDKFLARGRI